MYQEKLNREAVDAAYKGDLERLKKAIRQGATEECFSVDGNALHFACKLGQLDCIRYLIEDCGFDINRQSSNGYTALLYTIGQHNDCSRYLIDKGIDIHLANDMGWTPFHQAIYYPNFEMASFLVGKGVDLNPKGNKGWTPLHKAAFWNIPDGVEFLIKNGADMTIQDEDGMTPYMLAKNEGSSKSLEVFHRYFKIMGEQFMLDLEIKDQQTDLGVVF